jgi:hypothetical protein
MDENGGGPPETAALPNLIADSLGRGLESSEVPPEAAVLPNVIADALGGRSASPEVPPELAPLRRRVVRRKRCRPSLVDVEVQVEGLTTDGDLTGPLVLVCISAPPCQEKAGVEARDPSDGEAAAEGLRSSPDADALITPLVDALLGTAAAPDVSERTLQEPEPEGEPAGETGIDALDGEGSDRPPELQDGVPEEHRCDAPEEEADDVLDEKADDVAAGQMEEISADTAEQPERVSAEEEDAVSMEQVEDLPAEEDGTAVEQTEITPMEQVEDVPAEEDGTPAEGVSAEQTEITPVEQLEDCPAEEDGAPADERNDTVAEQFSDDALDEVMPDG